MASARIIGRGRVSLPTFTPTSLSGAELSDRTVGRNALIERILGFLRTAATSRNRPHMLVVGPRGSGKTHALAVVLHRAAQDPDIARQLAFAWIPEDAVGISSYDDLLVAAVEHLLDDVPGDQRSKQSTLDSARVHRLARDWQGLEDLVSGMLGGRVLVLVLENLDRIFEELGERGQDRLRGFMETSGQVLVLASTPLLFDAVSKQDRPWYGSFQAMHLDELSVEDGSALLERIAIEAHDDELARFLVTDDAQARMHAIADLTGGSPRMWMVLASCMSIELLEELAPLVETMLDQLAPYYQARLLELPPNERKLVLELCRTVTLGHDGRVVREQRGMRTVSDLAADCGMDPRVAATALKRLLEARWLRKSKPEGTDQRMTWYELREPLLRHYMQYRETRGEPLRVIVGFLRSWYVLQERRRQLAAVEPGTVSEQYLRRTVLPELRATDALYDAAIPEDLIAGARCLLDEEGHGAQFGIRSMSIGIVAEAIALDAWHGRAAALHACRTRMVSLDSSDALADVLAAALSAKGGYVSAASLLRPAGPPPRPGSVDEVRADLTAVQHDIANALLAAVPVADDRLRLHDRVTLRLLAAGWIGVCGVPAAACSLLQETADLSAELEQQDAELRLAVEADLAYFLFVSGQRRHGKELCAHVLAERVGVLGIDHPDTLRSRTNLAGFIGADRDHVAARDLFSVLAVDSKRVLGAAHPDTLANRHHHAFYVGEAGAEVDARDLFEVLAADCRWTLGAEHPRTLSSRHLHGYYVGAAGDGSRAADLYARLAEDSEGSLGADHPDTLGFRHHHAAWVASLGNHASAGLLFDAVAADRERVLGAEHEETLSSQYHHAYCLNRAEPSEAAALLAIDVHARAHHALGREAPTTRACRGLLLAVLARGKPVRSAVRGDAPRLWSATDAVLRFDPGFATEVLATLCVATSWVSGGHQSDAVNRVAQRAVRAGRAPELGAAVMRALMGMGADRRTPWMARWLVVSEVAEEHVVMHRMLRAAAAAFGGDHGALLTLPLEEKRIVRQIIDAPEVSKSDGWGD